jgi:hypothetical protein
MFPDEAYRHGVASFMLFLAGCFSVGAFLAMILTFLVSPIIPDHRARDDGDKS